MLHSNQNKIPRGILPQKTEIYRLLLGSVGLQRMWKEDHWDVLRKPPLRMSTKNQDTPPLVYQVISRLKFIYLFISARRYAKFREIELHGLCISSRSSQQKGKK